MAWNEDEMSLLVLPETLATLAATSSARSTSIKFWPNHKKKKQKKSKLKKKTMDKLRQVKKEKQQPTNKNVVKGRIQNNP